MKKLFWFLAAFFMFLIIMYYLSGKFEKEKKSTLAEYKTFIENVESMFSGESFPGLVKKIDKENSVVYVDLKIWNMRPNESKKFLVEMWGKYFDVVDGIGSDPLFHHCWVHDYKTNFVLSEIERGNVKLNTK